MMGKGKLPRERRSQRTAALVIRSAPARKRPRVSTEFEVQLVEVDQQMAGLYASMEELEDRIEDVGERLDDAVAIVVATDERDDISVVNHLEQLADDIDEGAQRIRALAAIGKD